MKLTALERVGMCFSWSWCDMLMSRENQTVIVKVNIQLKSLRKKVEKLRSACRLSL
jgi:hypothetical protein